ncbi:NUDIX hydrolase [Nocardioides sp. GXZ039]|uniref:NUDIX hydrolase n=1 Tax=Nocardioides sp. GXZ039 TaxID=3136018 RepID=UPI0030F414FE
MRIPLPQTRLPDDLVAVAGEYADGTREPAEPRTAATVLLMRASSEGPALYYLRRQRSMSFAGGMAVYPGGGVDPRDFDIEVAWAGPSPQEWATRLGVDEEMARALVCAAARETFEESGVLLAGASSSDVVADTTGEDWEADRVALESRELSLTSFLNRRGLVLRTDLLGAWDAWLTPVFEPRRFRTWFFVAALPEGQRTRDVSSESTSVEWLPARIAIDQADDGELAMMAPTYLTSMDVASYDSPEAVLAEAATRSIDAVFTPAVEPMDDGYTLSMPDRLRPMLAQRLAGRPPS